MESKAHVDFRWQAHDLRVNIGMSLKQNTDFVIVEGLRKIEFVYVCACVYFRNCDEQPLQQVLFEHQRHRMVLRFLKVKLLSHLALCLHM